LLGHDAAKAAARAGDEPVSWGHRFLQMKIERPNGQKRSPTISSLLDQSALACSGSSA
jgi:hypothetical protein